MPGRRDRLRAAVAPASSGFANQYASRARGGDLRHLFHIALDDTGTTRIAAQVVSGIGFLGAVVIFKEGLNVRGLNTAATLWCSAAVGLLAGEGFALYGLLAAVLAIGANTLLRPIVKAINRQPLNLNEEEQHYLVSIARRALPISGRGSSSWSPRCPISISANSRARLLKTPAASK